MNNSKIHINDFELLLQKLNHQKPSFLYNKDVKPIEQSCKPHEVIETVCSQVRALQLADCVRSGKSGYKNFNDVKKSEFLPINKLPVYGPRMQEVTKLNPPNIETQCFLDTQLMHIIDGTALINTNTGMTQLFDNTFTYCDDTNSENMKPHCKNNKNDEEKHKNKFLDLDERTKSDPGNVQSEREIDSATKLEKMELKVSENKMKRNEQQSEIDYSYILVSDDSVYMKEDSHVSKTAIADTVTFIENFLVSQEVNEELKEINYPKEVVASNEIDTPGKLVDIIKFDEIDTGQTTQRSVSPVLDMKAVKKLKTPSPLVVSLETFENFENVAISLIKETDFETAKHLINSQILGKELCLNHDAEAFLGIEKEDSEVLDFKSDELQITSNELMSGKSSDNAALLTITEKCSEIMEDEILFSSDEENFTPRKSQDLPQTCPLDIANDQVAFIDRTLYVGFQTASNKCIEISRDSYEQAQSIFSGIQSKPDEEFSLTELVEKCDRLKPKCRKEKSSTSKTVESCGVKTVEPETVSDDCQDRMRNETIQDNKKIYSKNIETNSYHTEDSKTTLTEFGGFITASNKKIHLCDEALKRCQNVFKDINLNEKFDAIEALENIDVEIKPCLEKAKNEVSNSENIDEKINDELLLNEFENIEMSLEEKENKSGGKEYAAFKGFKTANNKKITISEEAMAKTKNFFQDIDKDIKDQINLPKNNIEISNEVHEMYGIYNLSTSKAPFEGFKTANNKEIKISNEALAKSQDLFKDIGENKYEIKSIDDIISEPSTNNTISFVGFKTANNKDIKISNEALMKTKYIFKDIDKEQTTLDTAINTNQQLCGKTVMTEVGHSKELKIFNDAHWKSKNINNAKEFKIPEADDFEGLKTANNKIVKLTDFSIDKSRHFFRELCDENNTKIISDKSEYSGTSAKISFEGLKTANAKEVNSSTEVLEESKTIFSQINVIDSYYKPELSYQEKSKNNVFMGFETASKKPVKVSADALAKNIKIFEDIDNINDNEPINILETFGEYEGIESVNKRSVKVNDDALSASKKLIDDLSNTHIEKPTGLAGFKTASNKHVIISSEALTKSKKVLGDIKEILKSEEEILKSESNKEIFIGFQTGNKKKVEVSKEALEKVKGLFDDFNDLPKPDIQKSFTGFQTVSSKKLQISEQALEASRKLLENKENSINNKVNENCKKSFFGFKTGNNKCVTISEDAIMKSKKVNEINKKQNTPKLLEKLIEKSEIINSKLLDTQVINDFEQDVCTEDFKDSGLNKRSGSPILICPRAKKRKKFEVPYKSNPKIEADLYTNVQQRKPKNIITFKEDYKKNKMYTLEELSKIENGKIQTIDPRYSNFNLENILSFEFDEDRNDFQDGKMTIDDIKRIFTEGTDKKLIPNGWLDIHLKLILWKLISYEIRFPNVLSKVCTVRNVIDQLKYRYDKELYNAERSVLRKILEKDDVPSKTMVLCVAGIYEDGVNVASAANLNNIELLLTDGWYFIKATIDNMLSKLVYDGRITVGSKIVTGGAELVNCEQGVAPWEDTSAIRLSISGNSTMPARWDARLGLRPSTMTSRLAAVRVGGGRVTRLKLLAVRVYPRLYVEKLPDGSTVTRSERLENQYQMKYETEREAIIERIYEEVEKEMSDQESQDSDRLPDPGTKRKCLDSGSQIAKLMKSSKDPMEFRAQLTSSQVHLLQEHMSKQRDHYLQAIQDRVREKLQPRNVIALARGRVVGLERDRDKVTVTKGMLSIWKPNDEVLDIFKEGSWIEVTNVVPTAIRNSEIQLSAGRQSLFRPVKCKDDSLEPYLKTLSRIGYDLKELSQNPSMSTDYNEIDTVGIIFAIDPTNADFDSNKNQFQNLYLADIDKNMICVNFWGGIKKFGYENILDTGQVIYCGNLLKRAGNSRKNIPQFRATEFAIFTKTPKNEKGRKIVDEMNKKLCSLDRRKFCQDCVVIKQNFSVIRCLNDSENVTPYKFNNSDYNLGRNKIFIDTPVGVKVNKAEDFNLTGLDFESTFKQDTQLSPKSLERKRKVNEKIAKLKMYGEPPPLSPLNIINKSRNASSSYKSPFIKNETSNLNVASVDKHSVAAPIKLPQNCANIENSVKSPIISNKSLDRTYVKRANVNPVKLNFENGDPFAEEFDGSPPLSLE